MEAQAQKVLVVGCSQGVGLEVTKVLLGSAGKYEVHALVRNRAKALKALGDEATKVNFIDGDITKEETLRPACQGIDAVVCTVGASAGWRIPGQSNNTPKQVDFLGVKKLSEAAASAMVYSLFFSPALSILSTMLFNLIILEKSNLLFNVPRFVHVSSLAVTRPWFMVSILLNTLMGRMLVWKLKGEDAIREAYREHDNASYYIVRPGGLTNGEGGKHGIIVDQGSGMITRQDVARIVVACVDDECTPNSTFEVWNSKDEGTIDLSSLSKLAPDKI